MGLIYKSTIGVNNDEFQTRRRAPLSAGRAVRSELVNNYGRLDILWFDGNWVSAESIRLGGLIKKVRVVQPWVLSVNRGGRVFEDYISPENHIPDKVLSVPWESCIRMGTGWGYTYEEHINNYMRTQTLLRLLIDAVAKGGNLALNVGPQPDGRLPATALKRMAEMGAWLSQYGAAIYGTRICAPYTTGAFAFTQKAAEKKVFVFYMHDRYLSCTDAGSFAPNIVIPFTDKRVASVKNMTTGEAIPFEAVEGGLKIALHPSRPCPAFGGEPVAEVFEMKTEL